MNGEEELLRRLLAGREITPDGCWIWTRMIDPEGYGRLSARRLLRTDLVHRVAWLLLRGPIAAGLELDHLCPNKACFNPDHLEPVTHAENLRRQGARQTHCRHGHEFTPENTETGSTGHRKCVTCRRLYDVQRGREKRAAQRSDRDADGKASA